MPASHAELWHLLLVVFTKIYLQPTMVPAPEEALNTQVCRKVDPQQRAGDSLLTLGSSISPAPFAASLDTKHPGVPQGHSKARNITELKNPGLDSLVFVCRVSPSCF